METSSAWRHLGVLAHAYEHRARRGGATVENYPFEPDSIRLSVRFDDALRSPLYIDLHRPSWTMSVEFGQCQIVSEYPLSPRWLASLCRAVARGGWREETLWCCGLRVRTRAVLRILGQPATFTEFAWPLPVGLLQRWSRAERVEYVAWG